MKTCECEGDDGFFIAKIYPKQNENEDLKQYQEMIHNYSVNLNPSIQHNLLPYCATYDSKKNVALLIRQKIYNTLYKRVKYIIIYLLYLNFL